MTEIEKAKQHDAPQLCELCGKPDAVALGGRMVCADCYVIRGSCCTEFQEADEDAERIKRIAREVARQTPHSQG